MQNLKKTISILIVIVMVFMMCSCASSAQKNEKTGASADTSNTQNTSAHPDFVYEAKTLCSVKNTKDNALTAEPAVMTDSGFYAIGGIITKRQVPEGAAEEYEGQFDSVEPVISFTDFSGNVKVLENFSLVEEQTDKKDCRDFTSAHRIQKLLRGNDGNLYLVENVYTSWSESDSDVPFGSDEYYENLKSADSTYFRCVDSTGKEIFTSKLDIGDDGSYVSYYSILDGDNNLLLTSDSAVVCFDKTGKMKYSLDIDGYLYGLMTLRDGAPAAAAYSMTTGMTEITPIKNGCLEPCVAQLNISSNEFLAGSDDYDFYYSTDSSLFGYDVQNSNEQKVLNFLSCDILPSNLSKISVLKDGSVMAFQCDYSETDGVQTVEVIRLTKVPYDPAKAKKTLTLATLGLDQNIYKAITDFNKSHEDIRIDVKDYSEYNTEEDYSLGLQKYLTDIATGAVPDLMDISSDMPYRKFAASGILEDLYPYIDKDRDLSRDDFFANIMKILEADGKLYIACPSFVIETAAGAESVVGDKAGMTYDDYNECLSKMPEGCEGFTYGADRESMLSICSALEMTRFVDWKTGKCTFDSDDFKKILKFASSFPKPADDEDDYYEQRGNEVEKIAQGMQMMTVALFSSTSFMPVDYDRMFNGRATMKGFPTEEGIGHMLVVTNGIAMTSSCPDKEAAWEFIRTFFTEKYQNNVYYIPTNIHSFEAKIRDACTPKYETDNNGNYLLDKNGEKIPKAVGSYFDGAQEVSVYSLTERQADVIRKVIDETTKFCDFETTISDMIVESARPYFEGQKSLDETAKIIQSKVNIYVNEQK